MTERRSLLAVLLLAAFVALPLLGARDLWHPDEPRYAEVSLETLRDGHWWQPHVNGRVYPDKPPLYFWLAALLSIPQGRVTELTARLPSALAFLALVAITWHLGRRLIGATGAWVAGAALATTYLTAWMARRACLDVLLAALAAGAIACVVEARHSPRPWAWHLGAGALVGLGVMTKGPVILLFVLGALVPFAAARREGWRKAAVMGSLAIAGIAIVLAAWLVPARLIGDYHALAILREHVVDRATEGRDHVQPIWYFVAHVPVELMPWTLFAIPAMVAAWRRRPWKDGTDALLMGWALLPIVALSLIVEKRNIYVVPATPAWALLVGAWIQPMSVASRGLARAGRIALGLLVGAGGLLIGGVLVLSPGPGLHLKGDIGRAFDIPGLRLELVLAGAVAVLASLAAALAAKRSAAPGRVVAAVSGATAAFLVALFLLLPRLDAMKSSRAMGERLRDETRGAPLGMYPRTWDAYVFYSGRTITDLRDAAAVDAFLDATPGPAYVLAYADDLGEIARFSGHDVVRADSARVGHREIVLLRREPRRGAAP